MKHAGEAAQQGGNDVDPEIVINLAGLHINGKRGDEQRHDDLQNLVIHFLLSFELGKVVITKAIIKVIDRNRGQQLNLYRRCIR